MKRRALVVGLLLLVACREPVSTPAPGPATNAVAIPEWKARLDELTAAIKIGMSEDEVVKAVGEPNRTQSLVSSLTTTVVWEYDLPNGQRFRVRFDPNNRVSQARVESAMMVQ
jgi:hypothetical protein